MPVGILDQCRLAGGLVDREDRDRVLAAREHLLALEVGQPESAVGEIDKAPVGMDMDRARGLPQLRTRLSPWCPRRATPVGAAMPPTRSVVKVRRSTMVSSVFLFLTATCSFSRPAGTSAAACGRDRAATSRPARRRGPLGKAAAAPGRASASPGRRDNSKAAPRGPTRPAARRRSARNAAATSARRAGSRSAKAPPASVASCASARQTSSRSRSRLLRMSAKMRSSSAPGTS